jgi:ribosomal protein S18 acetylase RimI-like enzyme
MASDNVPRMTVRDAEEADVPALVAIKGAGSEALHRDRLRDARGPGFRYLVLSVGPDLVGFACLVFRRPAYWSDADDTRHLPQIVDLQVEEAHRGRGYGSALVHALEHITAAAGYGQLYLSVEPVNNPRAYALYQRLGYRELQPEPYRKVWEFKDSAGQVHRGEDWAVDMVKQYVAPSDSLDEGDWSASTGRPPGSTD